MAKKLFVAVPTYTGLVHAETSRCLMEAVLDAIANGWLFEYRVYPGCSIIHRVRNQIVSDFLQSDASDLVMIDADVVWEPGALGRIAAPDVDVCAGIYPHRTDPVSWPVRWIAERPMLIADPFTGLLEVEGVPAGFLRISRSALERLAAAHQAEWYNDAAAISKRSVRIFAHLLESDHEEYGEDFVFCRRWRALGGQIWIAPHIILRHVGYKTFSGCIGEWLKARAGRPAAPAMLEPAVLAPAAPRPQLIDDTPIAPVPLH